MKKELFLLNLDYKFINIFYLYESIMKENGVEIVQIPIEQHNLYVEKRNKSEKKKKKIKEKKERKLDDENNNEIERNFQNNNKIYYIIININIKDIIEKII